MLHFFARRMKEARKDESGFTLIELLVVVIIIGILAAIAILLLRPGELEIMSPSSEDKVVSRIVGILVGELAVGWEIGVSNAGSTTFRSEALERGFEPDECFYFSENAEQVRGKKSINLDAGDPPPDLVVEIDLINPSLNKLPIYVRLGVGEVWRFAGDKPEVLLLTKDGAGYRADEASRVLPLLKVDVLGRLVEEGLTTRRPEWVRQVREWARRSTS